MKVALVTDSNSQLPQILRERHDITVVPLTVSLAGVDHLEGVDLTTEDFYAALAAGASVATAAPSPGAVLAAYGAAAARGAEAVLSIHLGSTISATVEAVRLAADLSPVPVTVVDTGTASFAVGCCVWAAGEVLAAGGDLAAAEAEARRVAASIGNVFVVGALRLAASGGRLAAEASTGDGAPVLAMEDGVMRPVARAASIHEAMAAMTAYVAAAPGPLRVGVGDALAEALGLELVRRLSALPMVDEVVRYEIGASVGAHTGAGTVGAVFYPLA